MRGDMTTGSPLIDWGHSVVQLSSLNTTQFFKRWGAQRTWAPSTWHWVMNTLIFQLSCHSSSSLPWPFTSHPSSSFPPLVYLHPACDSWLTGRSPFWGVTNLANVCWRCDDAQRARGHTDKAQENSHLCTRTPATLSRSSRALIKVYQFVSSLVVSMRKGGGGVKHQKGRHFGWKLQ